MPSPQRITFVQTDFTTSTATKTTPTFNVQSGDLITVFGYTRNEARTLSAATWTGTGAVTLRQSVVGTASYGNLYCWTIAVTAAASGRTVSATCSSEGWGMHATVWRAHGGVGSSAKATATGTPSLALTCTAGSAVEVGVDDYNEVNGSSRTWRSVNGAGLVEASYTYAPGTYTVYAGYSPNVGAAGSKTFGLTAPAGQQFSTVAVEVLPSAAATVTASRLVSWTLHTPASASRQSAWNVATPSAFGARTFDWNVNASVGTDASAGNAGTPAAPQGRSTSWSALVTRSGIRVSAWHTRQAVTVGRATGWRTLAVVLVSRLAAWGVERLGSPTATMGLRLRVYAPVGADLGPLPAPQSVQVAYPLNDAGGLTFGYATRAPRSSLLGQPCELAVEVTPDSGITWVEPPNSRFVYTADGSDPLDPSATISAEAKGYVWRLSKAEVLPNGLLNNEGKRAFLSTEGSNPGVILKTLLTEAQTRTNPAGQTALMGLDHSSFTTTRDSASQLWAKSLTMYYTPGTDYLAILRNLADSGFLDFRMQGRSLQVFNPDAGLAVDRTVVNPPVVLRAGRDLRDAPYRRTWEGLTDYVFVAGDEGVSAEFSNAQAATPWGRQESSLSDGRLSDPGTMASVGQSHLSRGEGPRTEHTRTLDFVRAKSLPFFDYGVGDYIFSAVDGSAPDRLRVRQVTLSRDERARMSGSVVLNDRFLESDVRAARKVEGITGGAAGDAPLPSSAPDSVAPGQVTGLVGSSAAYLGAGGFAQAQVSLSWAALATNANGTPITDLDRYEVLQRAGGSPVGSERQVRSTSDASIDMSPYQTGSNWWFSVRAVDTSGNKGARSAEVQVGMASDTTPPQAPSATVMAARLGIVTATWDGLFATGTRPPDFAYVEVHVSTVNTFTPSTATLFDRLYGQGVSVVTGGAYGVPLFARLVAVDTSGLKSGPSAQGTATPTQLVNGDLIAAAVDARLLGPDAVTTAAIADLAVGTAEMKDLAVTNAKIASLAVSDAKIATLDVGKVTAGTLTADVLIGSRLMTASSGSRVEMSGTGIRLFNASALKVHINPSPGQIRVYDVGDASHTSTGHGMQFGDDNGENLLIDSNEIMSRFNGAYSNLLLNREGGGVFIGGRMGGLDPNGSRVFPAGNAHVISLRGHVLVSNTGDMTYTDNAGPLIIGQIGDLHTFFDRQRIGAATGAGPATLYLNPVGASGTGSGGTGHHAVPVVVGSESLGLRRHGSYGLGDRGTFLYAVDSEVDVGLRMETAGVVAKLANNSGYTPMVASAFTVGSQAALKEGVENFDPLPIVRAAKSSRWRYRTDVEPGGRQHFGPMLEDLPASMRRPIGNIGEGTAAAEGYDLGSLVGILWEAVRVLSTQVGVLRGG